MSRTSCVSGMCSGDNEPILRARLAECAAAGCKGYGEAMSGLYVDDLRLRRVYAICGELNLPIIFHIDGERNIDERSVKDRPMRSNSPSCGPERAVAGVWSSGRPGGIVTCSLGERRGLWTGPAGSAAVFATVLP